MKIAFAMQPVRIAAKSNANQHPPDELKFDASTPSRHCKLKRPLEKPAAITSQKTLRQFRETIYPSPTWSFDYSGHESSDGMVGLRRNACTGMEPTASECGSISQVHRISGVRVMSPESAQELSRDQSQQDNGKGRPEQGSHDGVFPPCVIWQ